MKNVYSVLKVVALAALVRTAWADCVTPADFDEWLQCRAGQLQSAAAAENQQALKNKLKQVATEKQTFAPAGGASTSLLDRTSGPDLAGASLQLASFGQKNGAVPSANRVVVTASAYALYTTASGQNPLSPNVYDRGVNWRRLLVTVGSEDPKQDYESQNKSNRVIGVKLLLLNSRDVSTSRNKRLVDGLGIGTAGSNFGRASLRVRLYITSVVKPPPAGQSLFSDANWKMTVSQLSKSQLDTIDEIIQESGLLPSLDLLSKAVKDVVRKIRTAPQLSVAYIGRLAEERNHGIDTHRLEAAFDYGMEEWLGITANSSFDYLNSRAIGADVRQARIAGELHWTPNHTQALRRGISPILFGINGEAKWMNTYDSIYRVQIRVEIPLVQGVTIPVSVTRSNRLELIKNSESEVRGQFGFTIDVTKLAGLFQRGR